VMVIVLITRTEISAGWAFTLCPHVISIRAPVQPQDFGTDVPMRVWKSRGRRRHMIEAVMCYVDAENRGWHSVCRFCT
jgi:hypothetical protein